MEKERIRSKKTSQGSWQEAAALRLNTKSTSSTTTTEPLQKMKKVKAVEDDDYILSNNGPTIIDLEAELDNLMKKIETENASILEVKAVNAKSRDYRNVIQQAKNGTSKTENSPSFFITSVTGGKEDNSPSKTTNSVSKYPNFEKEVKLAKELKMDKMDKKMAKLQLKANELQKETSSVLTKAKMAKTKGGSEAIVERKQNRRSRTDALPSLVKKR